jgi:hypothetical protein
MSIKKAIIGNSRFRDLAGSEVTTLELAEALRERGIDVWIGSFEFGGEVTEAARAAGCRLLDLSGECDTSLSFDLAWVHHAPTYYSLFLEHGVKSEKTIFSSLSHFEPLESPPIPLAGVSRYLVNSDENADFFQEQYPAFAPYMSVFPNAAPRRFWSSVAAKREPDFANLSFAVVSNHPPEEMLRAIELAQQQGLKLQIFGHNGTATRVTPEILANFDGVISIGKTVQYCLAMQMPIYCYDHFGGPGWIDPTNFDSARKQNFSGRCCQRVLVPEELVHEWSSGFPRARKNAADLGEMASGLFDLDANLDEVLSDVEASVSMQVTHDADWQTEANILKRGNVLTLRGRRIEQELRTAWTTVCSQNSELQSALRQMYSGREALESSHARQRLESEAALSQLRAELVAALGRENQLADQLKAIRDSFTWRVAGLIRNPLQAFRASRTNRN